MNACKTKLTTRWKTICITGYTGSVSRDDYNPAAHGGVCLCQARRNAKGDILARYVNSNGKHDEVGESFSIDADRVAHWEHLDAQQR
jgi:hypothetical protein